MFERLASLISTTSTARSLCNKNTSLTSYRVPVISIFSTWSNFPRHMSVVWASLHARRMWFHTWSRSHRVMACDRRVTPCSVHVIQIILWIQTILIMQRSYAPILYKFPDCVEFIQRLVNIILNTTKWWYEIQWFKRLNSYIIYLYTLQCKIILLVSLRFLLLNSSTYITLSVVIMF